MKKELLFSMASPYRDTFRIYGYRFGSGKRTLAIIGSMRGDEIQQLYICSQVVNKLAALEAEGHLMSHHEILIIPSANPFSMNVGKRFWTMDNTDINRMFPGYDKGETTQRIADALFGVLKGYEYGIQMASFYMPGDFIPHVRMVNTGYQDVESAYLFGLPYVFLRRPRPYDTVLLNYNWQVWNTHAFSIYAGQTNHVKHETSQQSVDAIMRFLYNIHVIDTYDGIDGQKSIFFDEEKLCTVNSTQAGIFYKIKGAPSEVSKGEVLAKILHPYEGYVLEEITAPTDGIIFFSHNKPLALQGAPLYKICPKEM